MSATLLESRHDGASGSPVASEPVVGVRTTKIYCRPACRPSRMPKLENRVPFLDAVAARAAGYRACKLCRPDDAVAPDHIRRAGELVRHGIGRTPLGVTFVATTERGLCALFFFDDEDVRIGLDRLAGMFPAGELVEDHAAVAPVIGRVAEYIEGGGSCDDVALDLRGTSFQVSVWEALRGIPWGSTSTYGEIARRIGRPTASRAVGAACGANPVSVLVPCHRAIGSDGSLVNYRWGLARKRALLERERGAASLPFPA